MRNPYTDLSVSEIRDVFYAALNHVFNLPRPADLSPWNGCEKDWRKWRLKEAIAEALPDE